MSLEQHGTDSYREYGPIARRRERDEDGNLDTFWDDECPDHPNHPLVGCELCEAEEEEEVQDDDCEDEEI